MDFKIFSHHGGLAFMPETSPENCAGGMLALKTRVGKENGHEWEINSQAYATGNDRCPVKYYHIFIQHRPK